MLWREKGYEQKMRRCKVCDQWDVRMTRAARYRLVRYRVEKRGVAVDVYAHPACMEKVYGQLWHLMLADGSEYDRVEGGLGQSRDPTQLRFQKATSLFDSEAGLDGDEEG